jgi:CubicO group peptidase (beta-lactamase class C family)
LSREGARNTFRFHAQVTEAGNRRERIEREVAHQMQRLGVPGVSLAVINDYAIEWAQGYGVREAGGNAPVDSETLFQAASVSKPVAALAALRLVEEGTLGLDEDVNTRLTSWKVPANEFTAAQKVTLRRLLSHSAGMTVHGFGGYSAFDPIPTLLEVLDGVPGKSNSEPIRVVITPGAQFEYSGGGYCVVQQLLMDVTGKPFPDLMRTAVLAPLDMQRSTYEQPLPESRRTAAATAHLQNCQPLVGGWHTHPEMAAAGLWTTPSDLARVAVEIQSAWAGRPSQIISSRPAKEMLTPQPGGWGLGISTHGEGKDTWFDHGGSNVGFICQLIANVAGQGAVVMTNSDNGGELTLAIVNALAQEYNWGK